MKWRIAVIGAVGFLFAMAGCEKESPKPAQEQKYDREEAKEYAAQLKDENADVRGNAAEALGMMKAKEYAKEVAELLKDKDTFVRWSAALALGSMEQAEYKEEAAKVVGEEKEFLVVCLVNDDFRAFAEPALRWLGYTVKKTGDWTWEIESAPKEERK